jgi:hypothetical protein
MVNKKTIKVRLEYLRGEIRKEQLSYGELVELQSLAKHIERGDIELLEPAGVPEGKWEIVDLNDEDCQYPF